MTDPIRPGSQPARPVPVAPSNSSPGDPAGAPGAAGEEHPLSISRPPNAREHFNSPAILARIASFSDERALANFSAASHATRVVQPKLTRSEQALRNAEAIDANFDKNFNYEDSKAWPRNPFKAMLFFMKRAERREDAAQSAKFKVDEAKWRLSQERETQVRATRVTNQLNANPGDLHAIEEAIELLFHLGRRDEGRAMLRALIKLDPRAAHVLANWLEAHGGLNLPESASNEDVSFVVPHSASPAAIAALAEQENSRMQDRASKVERELRESPQDPRAVFNGVCELFRLGRRSEGRALTEQLMQLDPSFAKLVVDMHRYEFRDGDDPFFGNIRLEIPPEVFRPSQS
jgi:tetratricopeptide (TPR) repeat protein